MKILLSVVHCTPMVRTRVERQWCSTGRRVLSPGPPGREAEVGCDAVGTCEAATLLVRQFAGQLAPTGPAVPHPKR